MYGTIIPLTLFISDEVSLLCGCVLFDLSTRYLGCLFHVP